MHWMQKEKVYYLPCGFLPVRGRTGGDPAGQEEERRGTIHGIVDLWVATAGAAPR